MTTSITELLQQKFPGSFQAMQIRDYLTRSKKPQYKLLHALIVQCHGDDMDGNFTVEKVADACQRLGILDASALNRFIQDPLQEGFIDSIVHLVMGRYTKFPWERDLELETNLLAPFQAVTAGPFPLQQDFRWDNRGYTRDPYMRILPIGVNCLRDLFSQSRVDGREYLLHRRDCDDRAIMFMAELAEQFRGDYAIGMIEFSAYDDQDVLVYRHACNISFHEQHLPTNKHHNFYLFDPVSHRIWNTPDATPPYVPEQAYIKLDKIWI